MKTIAMKNENGQYVGLALGLKDKDIVDEAHLQRLKPYVLNLMNQLKTPNLEELKNRFTVIKRADSQAAFTLGEGENTQDVLSNLRTLCRDNIRERLIVPQFMGDCCPEIRHRVMEFDVQGNEMLVKYKTLGELNNFDAAMNCISSLYPDIQDAPATEAEAVKPTAG